MRKLLTVVVVCLFSALVAQAGVITLTFEGLQNYEPINNYYNGGTGGFGSGPGPNYGITFTSDSLAIISGAAGGSGNFSGSPTMPTIAFFLTGAGDTMNVPAGFDTGFSFYYSAVGFPGVVNVYDDLNGGGSLLASLDLPVTPSGGAPECTYGAYCPWFPIGVSFTGVAKSVVFSGTANEIGFDNITLGASVPNPAGAVPEPATLLVAGPALLGLALYRRRRS